MQNLPDDFLGGKRILITGGGTGLGKEMALSFSQYGARVGIVSRNIENLNKAATDIDQQGYKVEVSQCDVREPDQIVRAVDTMEKQLGGIDILVNNAAGNFISRTEDLTPKGFDTIVGIVLKGSAYFSLELGKRWIKKRQKGTILSMVATYAWTGSGFVVPSAVAKAGVLALTQSLAVEWAPKGIRCVAIAPGPFKTEGAWRQLIPDKSVEEGLISRNPSRRLGEPRELANLAAFLVSDYADYINGDCITIDGGEWLYGAGQFNLLSQMGEDFWESYLKMIGRKK